MKCDEIVQELECLFLPRGLRAAERDDGFPLLHVLRRLRGVQSPGGFTGGFKCPSDLEAQDYQGATAFLLSCAKASVGVGKIPAGATSQTRVEWAAANHDVDKISADCVECIKLLADALAQRGIASVRIDKRGMFGSAEAVPDPNDVTVNDYVADIEKRVERIEKKRKRGKKRMNASRLPSFVAKVPGSFSSCRT